METNAVNNADSHDLQTKRQKKILGASQLSNEDNNPCVKVTFHLCFYSKIDIKSVKITVKNKNQ